MSGYFYVPAGHQPCLDFFMCQADNNHIWTFRDEQLLAFRGDVEEIIFIDDRILKENITNNTF